MLEKRCKQCGRLLPIMSYRQYPRRGKDIRKSKEPGRYTICKDCESLNNLLNRLWKKEKCTAEEEAMLEKGAAAYKQLAARGLEPKGAYATHVLGGSQKHVGGTATMDLLDALLDTTVPTNTDSITVYVAELREANIRLRSRVEMAILTLVDKAYNTYHKLVPGELVDKGADFCYDKAEELGDELYTPIEQIRNRLRHEHGPDTTAWPLSIKEALEESATIVQQITDETRWEDLLRAECGKREAEAEAEAERRKLEKENG